MLPFDRYRRGRVAMRPGTGHSYAAIGGGASPISSITQVTTITPGTAPVSILSEPFTYADQALASVNGGITWAVSASNPGDPVSDVVVLSNKAVLGHTGAGYYMEAGWALYKPALVLTTTYTLTATVTFNAVPAVAANATLRCRTLSDDPEAAYDGILMDLQQSAGTVSLVNAFTSAVLGTYSFGAPLTLGHAYALELRVNGNDFAAWVDGVQRCVGTTDAFAAQTYIGFSLSSDGTDALGPTLDAFGVSVGAALPAARQTSIVCTVGDSIYQGTNSSIPTLVTGGSGILDPGSFPQTAILYEFVYFVDGTTIQKLNAKTGAMVTFTATAGSLPAGCTLACLYRGRLVLAAPATDPQNFFASRVGVPTDWDYGQTDSAAAFAGNASTSGRVGDPIVALISFSDDYLLIGGDHNLWIMRGDPGFGGSIDLVSEAIGILGSNAWCKSPDGAVYFVGTGGLYKAAKGSDALEVLSLLNYPQYFAGLNRVTSRIQMVWDSDRIGAWIFATPLVSGPATHLWYDLRTNSLWPIVFPDAYGPTACVVYDSDGPADRMLMLGSRTGLIETLLDTLRTDDGTPISAYVVLGPFQPNPGESVLSGITFDMGELLPADAGTPALWSFRATIRAGKTAYSVTEGATYRTASASFVLDRRTKTMRQRLRGAWFTVALSNLTAGTYFSFESGELEFSPAGRNRQQR